MQLANNTVRIFFFFLTLQVVFMLTIFVFAPFCIYSRDSGIDKRLWHRCFPVNFAKFLGTSFLQNTSQRLLLPYLSISDSKLLRVLPFQLQLTSTFTKSVIAFCEILPNYFYPVLFWMGLLIFCNSEFLMKIKFPSYVTRKFYLY